MTLKKLKSLVSVMIFATSSVTVTAQQSITDAVISFQTVKQTFASSNITIEYFRPEVKGRMIYGVVVPYDKIWCTGANVPAKITFGENVKVQGMDVPAGSYAIYSIPHADYWDVMLYKDLTLGGNVKDYKKDNELMRFTLKPRALGYMAETFTINVADITPVSANVEMVWEDTRIAFSVKTLDAKK